MGSLELFTELTTPNGITIPLHATGAEDVDTARDALNGPWSQLTAMERGRLLSRLADIVEANQEILAAIESWDNGTEHTHRVCLRRTSAYVYYMTAWKLAPAVATGNCVILKAAEQTPLSILYLAALVKEAGFLPDVINIINGYGKDAGAALASHEDIDKIAFTGSTETGRQIMKLASKNLKNITLETGGKSPLIVFDDADLDKAVYWGHLGIMLNSGQVYDRFLELFLEKSRSAKLGDPFAEDTFQGPQVNKLQQDRVLGYIEKAKSEGASLVLGGERWAQGSKGKGYFIEPTVFTNVQSHMTIYREEIFGPVATVGSFKTEDEAVAQANDTQFGLGAALFTKDVGRIHRLTRKLHSGTAIAARPRSKTSSRLRSLIHIANPAFHKGNSLNG
ncbi:hypothetical protein S40293_01722 [Stachybotrys chartarum IBT 40293]|nr:hypothetical protein S40293_01722 [Stachybotrys chartarum IBT 40293]